MFYKSQTKFWLSQHRYQVCSIIGKFTQGSTSAMSPGPRVTFYDGFQSQYALLRATMLAYAHINLLGILHRFAPDWAVRVATDSIYAKTTALEKLDDVHAYVTLKLCDCGRQSCIRCNFGTIFLPRVVPRENRCTYLNGGGGSGKITRAIEPFRARDCLAKDMRVKGRQAQTCHSFFRWCDLLDARPDEREIHPLCYHLEQGLHVPRLVLGMFLDLLDGRCVEVICYRDQDQQPLIAGEMPHEWL